MDLTTRYMGLELASPLVASASPLNSDVANVRRLAQAGAGAIVLPSVFEEQIEAELLRYETLTATRAESFAEALSYFPPQAAAYGGTEGYLELIREAVAAVEVPIIGSLNGITTEGWVSYARQIEEAGASALELNIYFIPTNLAMDGRAVEQRYLEVLDAVRAVVSFPVAVKLGPYFSSPGNVALELDRRGADALVLFNRFYQPDIDTVQLGLRNDLELSRHNEIRLPLLWVAVLAGRTSASLAASTGVETSEEVVKYLLAGADVVMTTSALLRHGVGYMAQLLAGLQAWLAARDIPSLDQVRGLLSRKRLGKAANFERVNYMEILGDYEVIASGPGTDGH